MINTHQYLLIFLSFHLLSAMVIGGSFDPDSTYTSDKHEYFQSERVEFFEAIDDTSQQGSETNFDKTAGNTFKMSKILMGIGAFLSPSWALLLSSTPNTFIKLVLFVPIMIIDIVLWLFALIWIYDKFINKAQSNQ